MPGKKKKEKKEAEPEPLKPEDAGYDADELRVKIAAHEIRIRRYREENARLKEIANAINRAEKEEQEVTKDMVQRLTYLNDEKRKKGIAMQKEMSHLEDERNRMEIELKSQIEQEKEEHEEEKGRLNTKIEDLTQKLDTVQQFLRERESMRQKVESLEQQAVEREERHKSEIDKLKELHKEEREKLRSDMINKWRKTRLQVYKLTEDHLQTKTQQTIQENERLTRDLDLYAKECSEMMKHNDTLIGERAEAKRNLELTKTSNDELMKKSQHQQRWIKSLTERLQALEKKAEAEKAAERGEREERVQALNETIDKQYEIILERTQELQEVQGQLAEVQHRLDAAKLDSVGRQAQLSGAQAFLLQCLEDARATLCPPNASPASPMPGASPDNILPQSIAPLQIVAPSPTSTQPCAPNSAPPSAGIALSALGTRERAAVIERLWKRMAVFDSGLYPASPASVVPIPRAIASPLHHNDRGSNASGTPRSTRHGDTVGNFSHQPRPPPAPGGGPRGSAGIPPAGGSRPTGAAPRPRPAPPPAKDAAASPGDRLPRIPAA